MTFLLVFWVGVFIIFWGFLLLSFNFNLAAFWHVYENLFQGEIINKTNFALTSSFASGLNNDWAGNNDYKCYGSGGVYEDNDCFFRGMYGFLPPSEKFSITTLNAQPDTAIFLTLTWNYSSWAKVVLKNLSSYDQYVQIITGDTLIPTNVMSPWSKYLVEMQNLDDWWLQYFFTLSGSEGIKSIQNVSWNMYISQYYNNFLRKESVFVNDIEYKIWIPITRWTIINFLGVDANLADYTSKIHFNAGASNFIWYFIVSNIKTLPAADNLVIGAGTDKRLNCKKQLQGYYRNTMRGDVMRPIDQDTLQYVKSTYGVYTWLNVSGWLYTQCDDYPNLVYGETIFSLTWWSNAEIFSIQSWREYNFTWNNLVLSNKFTNSLEFVNYQSLALPVWYIYDADYGIGFIWGTLNAPATNRNLINYLNVGSTGNLVNQTISSITDKDIIFQSFISWSAYRYME